MKKLLSIISFTFFALSTVFAQSNEEFFTFSYQPGKSSPTTTIALGTTAQKYNIQYKLSTSSKWMKSDLANGTTVDSITITTASKTGDEYEIRYRLSNTDTPADVVFDFGNNAGKLTDIKQWGTKTGMVSFNFGAKSPKKTDQKYSSLINISASDSVRFSSLKFQNNTVFTGMQSNMDKWDVSRIKNMGFMFQRASNFNGNISKWNVSNVTNFNKMFTNALSFNQDISSWNVEKGTSFTSMLAGCKAFDQDLSAWTLSSASDLGDIFGKCGMSTKNYDKTIIGWWSKKDQLPNYRIIGVNGLKYKDSVKERQRFIDEKGWVFVGDLSL
jgi:surface protein